MTTPIQSISAENTKMDIFQKLHNDNTLQEFVTQENIDLLWNIIVQNKAFQTSIQIHGKEGNDKLRNYYINRVKEFVERVDGSTNTLVELNKRFIADFIRGFKSDDTESQHLKKLDLSDTTPVTKEVITIEEIKNVRLNEFENKYEKMQNDFNMYRKNDAPSDVDFSEAAVDEPIKGEDTMKNIVVNTLQTRNTEESEFIPVTTNISEEETRKWLNLKENENSIQPENVDMKVSMEVASGNNAIVQNPGYVSSTNSIEDRLTSLEKNIETISASISSILSKIDINTNTLLLDANELTGNIKNISASRNLDMSNVIVDESEYTDMIQLDLRPLP
jgi:hypothetical protein